MSMKEILNKYLNKEKLTCLCDKCKNEFDLNIQTRKIDNNVVKQYIKCPFCEEEYTVMYLNEAVKTYINNFKKAKTINDKEEYKNKIKKEVERLCTKYEKSNLWFWKDFKVL